MKTVRVSPPSYLPVLSSSSSVTCPPILYSSSSSFHLLSPTHCFHLSSLSLFYSVYTLVFFIINSSSSSERHLFCLPSLHLGVFFLLFTSFEFCSLVFLVQNQLSALLHFFHFSSSSSVWLNPLFSPPSLFMSVIIYSPFKFYIWPSGPSFTSSSFIFHPPFLVLSLYAHYIFPPSSSWNFSSSLLCFFSNSTSSSSPSSCCLVRSFLRLWPSSSLNSKVFSSSTLTLLSFLGPVGELHDWAAGWRGRLLEITWFTFPALGDAILEESLEFVDLGRWRRKKWRKKRGEGGEKRKLKKKRGGIYTERSLTRMHNAGCAGNNTQVCVPVRDKSVWTWHGLSWGVPPGWTLKFCFFLNNHQSSGADHPPPPQQVSACMHRLALSLHGNRVFFAWSLAHGSSRWLKARFPLSSSRAEPLRSACAVHDGAASLSSGEVQHGESVADGAPRSLLLDPAGFLWYYFKPGLLFALALPPDFVLLFSLDVSVSPDS